MEEQIPLKERLKYMIGPRFDRVNLNWNGATVARGYYFFFGFYWFCFCFFRRWPLDFMDSYSTGFSFAYKPNPNPDYGALLWLKETSRLRHDRSEDFFHAKKI